jgi:hypothetical protein
MQFCFFLQLSDSFSTHYYYDHSTVFAIPFPLEVTVRLAFVGEVSRPGQHDLWRLYERLPSHLMLTKSTMWSGEKSTAPLK